LYQTVVLSCLSVCLSICLSVCLSVTLVYCGQTVGWIKMKLDAEVGLGPSHIVSNGHPTSPPPKGHSPPIFVTCQLWPNGWMDQDATWYGCRPQSRRHFVRWGPSSRPKQGHIPPIIGPCLLWSTGRPSQLLLSTCFVLSQVQLSVNKMNISYSIKRRYLLMTAERGNLIDVHISCLSVCYNMLMISAKLSHWPSQNTLRNAIDHACLTTICETAANDNNRPTAQLNLNARRQSSRIQQYRTLFIESCSNERRVDVSSSA